MSKMAGIGETWRGVEVERKERLWTESHTFWDLNGLGVASA